MKYEGELKTIINLIKKDDKLLYYYEDFDLFLELLEELGIYEKEAEIIYIISHYLLIIKLYE